MKSPPAAASPWLFGALPDLLFGCGLAYALFFAFYALSGNAVSSAVTLPVLTLVLLVCSSPHYGATLLRVYERSEDRRAYRVFAVWATAALAAAFVVGLHHALVGSLLVTIYLTWSPWHYTAQNRGIAMLFLRRRGAAPDLLSRRLLWISFGASFAMAFVSIHAQAQASYVPNGVTGYALPLLPIGIPQVVHDVSLALLAPTWLLAGGVALGRLAKRHGVAPIVPALMLFLSQGLWFTIPVLTRALLILPGVEPLSHANPQYAFLWIALAHSVQYVWVATYYATRSDPGRTRTGFIGMSLAAGIALWTLPALLFAPNLLGGLPYESGLGVLVASVVNIHHFMLDGVIWKLRQSRIAGVLIRPPEPGAGPAPASPRRTSPVRAVVAIAGAASIAISVTGILEAEFGVERAFVAGDVRRLVKAERRLGWIGRASPDIYSKLGVLYLRDEEYAQAVDAFQRSIELYPTAAAWINLGYANALQGRLDLALQQYEAGLEIDPDHVDGLLNSGFALLRLRRYGEAVEHLDRAAHLAPEDEEVAAAARRARALLERSGGVSGADAP